jgi:hypothetical protein
VRVALFRAPKVLVGVLGKKELLARLGTYENVVLFDPERLKGRVYGHREVNLCPQCFFEKVLNDLDPTCPFCKKRIRDGGRVWLVRYTALNFAERHLIKVLKAKYQGFFWAVCCCSGAKPSDMAPKRFRWNSTSRNLLPE